MYSVKYNKTGITKHTSRKMPTATCFGTKVPPSGCFISAQDHKPNMQPTAAAGGLEIYH